MGTQFFSAVAKQKLGGPFGRRECGSPELWGGPCGFPVKAHPWRRPTCSSSCSAGRKEGADARDILNLTSCHNLLVWGRGEPPLQVMFKDTVPEGVSSETPCILSTVARAKGQLFLSGCNWFCNSSSKVIAHNQKCRNSFPCKFCTSG